MPKINWIGWGIGLALISVVYSSAITRLVTVDWSKTDFDYCYLIPFVVLYLIWERKDALQNVSSSLSWGGVIIAIWAVCLLLLGELGGEFLVLYLSFWFALVSLAWTLLGWEKLKIVMFPLGFLLTAFPPPDYVYSRLTLSLQLISTRLGSEFLHVVGVPAFREGNVIDLGFTKLEVVAACSGLRFLIPLIIVGILLTFYFKGTWWKRILLLSSTLPLAVVMNGLRIGVTGLLTRSYGVEFAEGATHDIFGWIMFVLSTFILLGFMHVLADKGEMISNSYSECRGTRETMPASHSVVPLVVVLFVFGCGGAFVKYRQMTPDFLPHAKSLQSFPTFFEGWNGKKVALDQDVINDLHFTDYVQMDFKNPDGHNVDFYVAWYASQSKGESIHSPETCLRGGGWQFEHAGSVEVVLPGYKTIRVNRSILEQNGQHLVAYFWFPARGNYAVNGVELKLQTFIGSLLHRRTDGALVRLITPLYLGESESQGEERLQDFMSKAIPTLESMLPQ